MSILFPGIEHDLDLEVPALPQIVFIVGLGNPGRQYRNTRHNVGFMVMDRLADRIKGSFTRLQFRALVIDTHYEGKRLILAKPQTYMNESGRAVDSLIRFYKIPLTSVLVVHDDADLSLGMIRIRPGGGSAGQKGVESIIDRLGAQDFPRLRIGIGRPPGQMIAAAYVLQDFDRSETELLGGILNRASEAALSFVTSGLEKTMNQYNGQL